MNQYPYLALVQNEANGLYDIEWPEGGNPVFVPDRREKVLSLLLEWRGKYWADQAGKRGSVFYTIKNAFRSTESQLKAAALEALAPLIDRGELLSVQASAMKKSTGSYKIFISWSEPSGTPQSIGLDL